MALKKKPKRKWRYNNENERGDITDLPEEDKNITFTARLGVTDQSLYLPQTMESFLMSLPEVVEADNEETEEFELD